MEFYLDLLYNLCKLGDNFLGVYTGLKCLVATKVNRILCTFEMKFVILDLKISMCNLLQSVSNLNNPSVEILYVVF
jgi:hypothetical protein